MYANLPALPGPAYTGRPVNVDRITDAILAATDGATVGSTGTPYAGDGILVALPEHGGTCDLHYPRLRHWVREWVAEWSHAVTVVSSPRRYFGAWVDAGTLHLDVVEAFSSAEEDRALDAARRRGQLAVWHAGRRECVWVTSDAMLAA